MEYLLPILVIVLLVTYNLYYGKEEITIETNTVKFKKKVQLKNNVVNIDDLIKVELKNK